MQFNILYNGNNETRIKTNSTNQTVAGLSDVGIYLNPVQTVTLRAPIGNTDAASVIQSNGENIGNARLKSNPLPPGITK
jgi:hypothetical protein